LEIKVPRKSSVFAHGESGKSKLGLQSPSPRGTNEFVQTNYWLVRRLGRPSPHVQKKFAERTHRIEQDVFSGNSLQAAWRGRCFSSCAVRSIFRNFAERTEELENVLSEQPLADAPGQGNANALPCLAVTIEAAMPLLEIESSLTDRYQTTVPDAVRRALKLRKRDRIVYRVLDDGTVVLGRKSVVEDDDPVIDRFLAFLANDMSVHPEHVRAIDAGLLARIRPLIAGMEVDFDAPLAPDDE